ncbi:Hypothetical_protein [Hexamita inflata]|uniref:Hypothetical_protein n=1 Tax=Hexamita inflata TaxID=28002 RepID=A0AA86UVK1_9EUKA|nr:Hypothetical protein HINF_LOCUS54197 [Hexamita inflata]
MNELRKKTRPKPKNKNIQNFVKPESHPETINLLKSPPKLPQSPIQSSSSSDTRKLILSQKINTIRPQNKPKPPKPKSRKIVVERPPVQNPRDNMEQIQREKAEKILSMLERVDSVKVSRSNSIYDSDIENEDEIIQEQIIKIDSLQSSGIIKQKESFDLSKVQTMKVNNAQQQISQIQQSSQIEQQSTNIQVKLVPKPQLNQITVNKQLEIQYQQPKIKVVRATKGKQQDNVDNNNVKLNVQIQQQQNNEIDTIRTLRKLNKPKGITFNFETNEVEYNENNSIIQSNYQQSPINLKDHNINNQYSNIIRNEQKENLDIITKPTYKRQQAPTLGQQDYFNSQITQQNILQNPDIWTHQAASMSTPDVAVVKKVVPPVPSQEYPPQSNQTQPLNNELPKQTPMQQQRSLSQTQEVEVIEEVPKAEPVQAKQAPKLPASNAPPKGNMKAIFNFSEYVFDEDPDNKVDYQMMEPKKKKVEVLKVEKEPDVQAVSAQPSEVKEEPKLAPKIAPKISIPPQAKVQPKIPGKAPEQSEGKPEAEKPKEDQSAKASAPPKGNMKAIFNFSEYVFDEDPENKVDYEMMEPKKKKTEPAQVKEPEPAAQLTEVKQVEKQKEEPVVEAKQAAKAAPLKVQLPLPPNKIQPKIPGKAPVIPKATGVQQQQEAKPEGEPKAQPPSGNMKAIFNFSEYVFDEDPENKVDYEMLEPKKKKTEKEPEAPKAEKEQEIQAVSSQPSEVKEEAKQVKITPKINIPPQVKIQPKIQPKIQIPSKDQNETKIQEDKQSNLNDNKSEQELQTIKTDQKPAQNQGIQSIKPLAPNSIKPPLKIPPKQASLLTQQNLTKQPSNTNLQNQQISLDLGDLEQNLSKEPKVVEEVKITKVAPKIIVPPKIQMKLPVKK